MKKLIICLNVIALSMCAYVSYGKAVDQHTAQSIGSNFLVSEGVQGVQSPADLTVSYVANTTVNGASIPAYYVFNINGQKGFVMVSADDRVRPVLAFSNESAFDISNMSPDTKYWIDGYSKYIGYMVANDLTAKSTTGEEWAALSTAKAPVKTAARTTTPFPSTTVHLVQTTWDQEPNYNHYCPTGTPTGCVATCMAEVMQFWNWPTVGTGSHSYVAAGYGTQSADFGTTVYDWATMDAHLTSSTTATALLMYHCGVAVNMDYTNTSAGSGSYVTEDQSPITNCAEYALKTYFHYKPSLKGYSRSGSSFSGTPAIPDATWNNMIETDLNAGHPVMYTGQGSDGGHCWICDGFEGTTAAPMYHFNFGWSGASNGYYSIDDVAPAALGTGGGGTGNNFNDQQSIIVGIVPDSFSTTTSGIKMASFLNSTTSYPVGFGKAFSFSAKITNCGSTAFSGSVCAQVFDTSNVLKGTIQTFTGQTIAAGASSGSYTFATTGMPGLIPEDYYHVQVMTKATSASTWTAVANNDSLINYSIVSVSNDTDLTLSDSLQVTSTLPVPLGGGLDLFSQVANFGTSDFSGTMEAVIINITTGTSYTIGTLPGSLRANGGYDNFSYSGTIGTAPAGAYALEVKHQYNSAGSFYTTGSTYFQNPILIHVGSQVQVQNVQALEDKITVYPNPANDVININAQGVNMGDVRIVDINGREVRKVNAGSQSQFSVQVSDLASGIYFIQVGSGADVATKKIVIAK